MRALSPDDEASRLKALHDYEVLDTAPEQAYDDIVHLASMICATPIALVSLVAADRQWFKASMGLEARETPRSSSFCAHALPDPDNLLVVADAAADDRFAGNPLVLEDPHIRFYAGAPLVTPENQVLGTLCVIDRVPRQLSTDQEETLRVLARQVVAQLELRRKMRELQESQLRLHAFLDNSPAATFLKDEAGRYVYANPSCLRNMGKSASEVIGKTTQEVWPEADSEQLHLHDLMVWRGNQVVNVTESAHGPDGDVRYWQTCKFPIETRERLLGGVAIDITQNKIYQHELENYQRRMETTLAKLEILSSTDELTGLKNRRMLDERLLEEFSRARRYHLPLSFLMLDVDEFKQFNDQFGHPAGDEVLQLVAGVMQKNARSHDMVARYGGEEFAVILPSTGRDRALSIAERIREAVERLELVNPITISIGVASIDPDEPATLVLKRVEEIVELADQALYRAKQAGRNCVHEAIYTALDLAGEADGAVTA